MLFYNNGLIKERLVKSTETFFVVNTIQTVGRERASKNDLSKILKKYQKTSLLSLDLNYIQSEVEKVAWIKKVIIRRVLPNTLSLTIEEFSPRAVWIRGRDRYVLDKNGYTIEKVSDDQFQNYFTIKGAEAELNLMNLIESLENFDEIYNQIDYANYVGRRRWDLHYKSGVRIMLPEDNIIDSLSLLETYIKENKLIEKGHKKIDLRVDGKITTDRVNSNG
ncbi:MAG: FtsQ-type POTRA domain-containing protein [Hyphomicrobiales bacterium]|jgi:cell division protein FtsQ|nr:FtsQ-type POTRA domain-containing protein [Alphaproteobacteria bacterium]MDG2413347.1 FtsQ-type POTRA domain-containing protein [Hyphomicrobiales bacterium]|tara:strand:- start:451 stop:1113 length:663 start_codon:yes stop_codon:yes gene_type:complete